MDEPTNPDHQPKRVNQDTPLRTSESESEVDPESHEPEDDDTVNEAEEEEDNEVILNQDGEQENSDASAEKKPDDQLEEFRHQWHVELKQRPGSGNQSPQSLNSPRNAETCHNSNDLSEVNTSIEDQARAYFIQGMESEDDGQLTEAIYFYRKALQLVPDIESKLGNIFNTTPKERVRQESESSIEGNEEELLESLNKLKLAEEGLCQMEFEQRMSHISCLPVEIVVYILLWVVSSDLDLRSLEMFSRVCKGFYMCARDDRVWRKACARVWGLNLGSAKKYGSSWRRMMIERPRMLYDGCYISKVTYVRQGEKSMDNFYRPYHLVEYYRYIRFFPDGQVLMLVSPEDPLQSLPKLKNRNSKAQGILRGGYRLADQKVTCLLKRVQTESYNNNFRYKRQQRQANQQAAQESTYMVVCSVVSSGRRSHAQMTWESYSISSVSKSTGEETTSYFDLSKRSFPNLIFSRVKSYVISSTEPLS